MKLRLSTARLALSGGGKRSIQLLIMSSGLSASPRLRSQSSPFGLVAPSGVSWMNEKP